jgi:hypothetical protein
MTLLGEVFGYDQTGNDLIGVNRDDEWNCVCCGISSFAHTPAMEQECLSKIFGWSKKELSVQEKSKEPA